MCSVGVDNGLSSDDPCSSMAATGLSEVVPSRRPTHRLLENRCKELRSVVSGREVRVSDASRRRCPMLLMVLSFLSLPPCASECHISCVFSHASLTQRRVELPASHSATECKRIFHLSKIQPHS